VFAGISASVADIVTTAETSSSVVTVLFAATGRTLVGMIIIEVENVAASDPSFPPKVP
jgi:hypothetical protein